jgi:integrase
VTVASVYVMWAASQGHIAPRTAGMRRGAWSNRVEPAFGDMAVIDVKISVVKAWIATMADQEIGAASIEQAFGVLRGVMAAALEDNRIARNPCDGVKLPKRKHSDRGYLTHSQVAALVTEIKYLPEVPRFLAYTGLRWGEMAALRVQDFDMLRRRLNVSRSVVEYNGLVWSTPKSHERRSIRFPASMTDGLSALMVGKGREDLVFTTHRGGVLRVQRMLGHAKASMTLELYADLFDNDLGSVADGLDVAMNAAADSLRTSAYH